MGASADRALGIVVRALPLTSGLAIAAVGRATEVEAIAAVGILVAGTVAGDALVPARARAALTSLERAVVAFVAGLVAIGGLGLLLADLALWRPWLILALVIGLGVAGIVRDARAPAPETDLDVAPPRLWRREDAVLAVLAVVVLALAWPPSEWILGGRDPGLYVSGAYRIGTTGAIAMVDPDLAFVPASAGPETGVDGRLMGFYLDPPTSVVVPHGYHLLPAVMAAGGVASGKPDGRLMLPLIGVAGLLGAALVARRLAPRRAPPIVAASTFGLMSLCLVVFWYLRFPANEPLAMACLMAGSLLLAAGLPGTRGAHGRVLFVAGLLLGAQLLVRPDALVAAPAMVVAAAWWIASGRSVRATVLALAGAAITLVGGALHGLLVASGYTQGVFGQFSIADGSRVAPIAAAGAAVVLGLGLVARRRLPAILDGGERRLAAIGAAAGLVIVGGLGAAAAALDWLGGAWLALYVTPLLLLIAVGGSAVVGAGALVRDRLGWSAPLLMIGVVTAAIYLRTPQIFPDQPWAARRFLPVVLPLVVGFAAIAIASACLALQGRARAVATGLAIAVVVAFGVRFERDLDVVLGKVEYEGATAILDELDARIGSADALVLMGTHEVAANRFAVALDVRTDRIVVPFRRGLDGPIMTRVLEAQVGRRPVVIVEFGRERPQLPPGFAARRVGVIPFSLPELSRPTGTLPTKWARIVGAFTIYRVVRGAAPA